MGRGRGNAGRLSAPAYFGCVLLLTLSGVGACMALRPAFGHRLMQQWGLEAVPQATPGSFYAVRVAPLFDANCVSCHGEARQKGGLKLDSFAGTVLGGRHVDVRAGDAKASELMTRITLPQSDDRAMPPSGKTPLSEDEITVIRLWIAHGASGSLPVAAVKGAPKLVKPVVIPDLDLARTEKLRAPLAATVAELQKRYAGVVTYQARDSADLEVNASLIGPRFGDADVKALAPVAAHIVRIDLSGTAVTDASSSALAAMGQVESVRLSDTKITDATIRALDGLKRLKVLAVTGTAATGAAFTSLRQRGVAVYAGSDGN